jgi:hypothetical protein
MNCFASLAMTAVVVNYLRRCAGDGGGGDGDENRPFDRLPGSIVDF